MCDQHWHRTKTDYKHVTFSMYMPKPLMICTYTVFVYAAFKSTDMKKMHRIKNKHVT